MFRLGIVTKRDLKRHDWLRPRRVAPSISCTLLADLGESTTAIEDQAIDEFFIQTRNGPHHCKATRRYRYETVDRDVIQEMEAIFPKDHRIRVHDMAASSAITSLEFYEALAPWTSVELHASDLYDEAYVVTLPSGWKVAFDAERKPWQFIGKRMVISAVHPERKRYPVNRWLQRALTTKVLPAATAAFEAGEGVVRVPMFHPMCVALAREDERFSLGRHNITEPTDKPYEVVRLMMYLSAPLVARYFPDDHIARTLRAVGRSVVDGGLLVAGLGQATDRTHQATIFRRSSNRLVLLRDICAGFNHKETALAVDLAD